MTNGMNSLKEPRQPEKIQGKELQFRAKIATLVFDKILNCLTPALSMDWQVIIGHTGYPTIGHCQGMALP